MNIVREFVVNVKLLVLIKLCLHDACCKVRLAEHLSGNILEFLTIEFAHSKWFKQGEALYILLFNFVVGCTVKIPVTVSPGGVVRGQ